MASGQVVAGSLATIYIVPSSYALVLKHVGLTRTGTSTLEAQLLLVVGAGPENITLWAGTLTAPNYFSLATWTVLNATDRIQLYSGESPVHFWVAGALLPTP